MIRQFHYESTRQMDQKDGRNFATKYYKLHPQEYARVKQHIVRVAEAVDEIAHYPDVAAWLDTPQKQYRKTTGEYYTPGEIVTDMLKQVKNNRDITQGLLGRWRRLFARVESCDFELTDEHIPTTNFGELFKIINK